MEAAQRQPDAVTEAQTRHGCGAAAVEIPTKSDGKMLQVHHKKLNIPSKSHQFTSHFLLGYLQEPPCHC